MFISLWDAYVIVPPSDSVSEVSVVLARRGDRTMLKNASALSTITASVLKKIQPQAKSELLSDKQRRLEAVAEDGAKSYDVGHAIRPWGLRLMGPNEKGLAALYEKHALLLQAKDDFAGAEPALPTRSPRRRWGQITRTRK